MTAKERVDAEYSVRKKAIEKTKKAGYQTKEKGLIEISFGALDLIRMKCDDIVQDTQDLFIKIFNAAASSLEWFNKIIKELTISFTPEYLNIGNYYLCGSIIPFGESKEEVYSKISVIVSLLKYIFIEDYKHLVDSFR